MGHHHGHHHHHHGHHHHHHDLELSDVNNALLIGIALNVVFVIIEGLAGWWYDSLALLSDAGHNFSDVIALVMALVAFKLLEIAPTKQYTYGYRKTTIWAALINAVLLLIAVAMIFWESLSRWMNPVAIDGKTTAIIAAIGIVINGLTAWLFVKDKDKDLNIKGAYLHMLADTMVSAGVVVSGVIIFFTNWYWIDILVSWGIILMILLSTWPLLKDSIRVGLDGVPRDIDLEAINKEILKIEGVVAIHHIHVWALSTTENALTAHLVIKETSTFDEAAVLKKEIKHLLEHKNIQHVTLELEREGEDCQSESCDIVSEKKGHDCHHH